MKNGETSALRNEHLITCESEAQDFCSALRRKKRGIASLCKLFWALLNFKWVIDFWVLKNKNFLFVTHSLLKRALFFATQMLDEKTSLKCESY